MNNKKPKEFIREGLLELGFAPISEHINLFSTYLSELKKWSKTYNLTGLKKDEDIIIKHFLDSILYLKAIPGDKISIADIGSGAGFPGIPIKIIRPEVKLYLIEASGKKSAFLRYIIKHMNLQEIEVIEKRVEGIKANNELPVVDVAVTRALFTVKDFIKKASHIVKTGGMLVLSKGPKVEDEIKKLGDVEYEIITAVLPFIEIKRHLVVVNV